MTAKSPSRPRRVNVLGCEVDNLTLEETLAVVEAFIATGRPHRHVCVNADKVVKAARDPEIRSIVNGCDLVSADGMPVVWASHLLGTPLKERVAGIDLFEALMARAAERGWRAYLLGARPEVVRKVKEVFEARHPGLAIAGARDGYWKPEEEPAVAEAIRASRADLLFVAVSSPRKERFLHKWESHMGVPFVMGVGGSFDVAAGLVKRAPAWMQRAGLEWFARFAQEPRRMFRRYFVDDMAFFGMLARELGLRSVRRAIALVGMGAAAFAVVEWAEI